MKQFIFMRRKLFLLSLCLSPMVVRADFSQSSADYHFTAESTDGGGLRVASTDYVSDGSVSPGNFVTSADYVQRGGYIGQLNNPPVVLPQTFQRATNATLNILLSSLTGTNGATDPEGDTISVAGFATNTPYGAAVTELAGRLMVYSPKGWTGSDTINWTALDSEGDTAPGVINIRVPMPTNGPMLNLISATASPGGGATLLFAGFPPATDTTMIEVQYTTSLTPPVTWIDLPGTFTVTNGVLTVTDTGYGGTGSRFYRTIYQ
jgi:hypothetical protein